MAISEPRHLPPHHQLLPFLLPFPFLSFPYAKPSIPIPFLDSHQSKPNSNHKNMDYYKILGLNTDATKDEIKQAFRTIAKKFHPDKHSSSPKSVKDGATFKFKQASEAYEVLVDDRKRAEYNNSYNRSSSRSSSYSGRSGYGNYGYGYTYDNRRKNYDYYNNYADRKATVSRLQIVIGYINSRAFLLNVAFAGAILSGLAAVEIGRDAIWRSQNPGKSFEEAMESIHKTKAIKEEE